jgi:predicted enzyme related to lactoylglutathione lyase
MRLILRQTNFKTTKKNQVMKLLEIVMLPVSDRQKAKEFYLKLGFAVTVEATDPHGDAWIQMGLPGGNTTISLAGFQAMICETDDIAQEIEQLAAKGIEVGKIDDTPWGRFAWLKDPDGNSLCLHQK